jgi:plasmid maintenance system antidote protein VapI
MSPKFWLGLQMDYELDVAEDMLEGRLEKEITPMSSTG